jgi:hypothetical protein
MVPLVDVHNVMEIEEIWSIEKTTHLDTSLTYILGKKLKNSTKSEWTRDLFFKGLNLVIQKLMNFSLRFFSQVFWI